MEPPKTLAEFVSAESLSKHLGVSRNVLLDWLNRGLPYIRVGMRLYFREAAVCAWLASQEHVREQAE